MRPFRLSSLPLLPLVVAGLLTACQAQATIPPTPSPATSTPIATASATASPTSTDTGTPTATATSTSTATPSPSATPSPTSAIPAEAATPLPTRAPEKTPTMNATPAPSGSLTVTLADNGHTITLHPGDRFLLQLGEGWTWNVSVDSPAVVSRLPNILVVRGAQGIYLAHQPGQATLTAVGDPLCRQSNPPCAIPSRAFRVTIVVQ